MTLLAGGARVIHRYANDDSQMATFEEGATLQGAGVMVSYSYFPASWFGFDVGLGLAPLLAATSGGTGASAEIDLRSIVESTRGLAGRLSLYFHPGRKWLVSLGAVVLPPVVPVPVLGVSRRW